MPTLLTSIDRVKAQLFSGITTDSGQYDDVLDQLVVFASDKIETMCNRVFAENSYTHYFDGKGDDILYLREGPLVTLTSVKSVVYEDDGAGGRSEMLTTVDAYTYVEGGLRTEGAIGAGFVRSLTSIFEKGTRNFQAVYTAGFNEDTDDGANNIPQALVAAATDYAASMFNLRDLHGLTSRELGEGELRATIPLANLERALEMAISPFRIRRFP